MLDAVGDLRPRRLLGALGKVFQAGGLHSDETTEILAAVTKPEPSVLAGSWLTNQR